MQDHQNEAHLKIVTTFLQNLIEYGVSFPLSYSKCIYEIFAELKGVPSASRKQVIVQKVRDAEIDLICKDFEDKKGELINGIVRRFEHGDIIIDLGKVSMIDTVDIKNTHNDNYNDRGTKQFSIWTRLTTDDGWVKGVAGDIVAEDLLQAQNSLSEITGEFTNEELLDSIFNRFCIGK